MSESVIRRVPIVALVGGLVVVGGLAAVLLGMSRQSSVRAGFGFELRLGEGFEDSPRPSVWTAGAAGEPSCALFESLEAQDAELLGCGQAAYVASAGSCAIPERVWKQPGVAVELQLRSYCLELLLRALSSAPTSTANTYSN